jgi:hypothetical protein
MGAEKKCRECFVYRADAESDRSLWLGLLATISGLPRYKYQIDKPSLLRSESMRRIFGPIAGVPSQTRRNDKAPLRPLAGKRPAIAGVEKVAALRDFRTIRGDCAAR